MKHNSEETENMSRTQPAPVRRMGTAALALTAILAIPLATPAAEDFAFITTTDYFTGSSSKMELSGGYNQTINVASVHSDAVARYYDGFVYVVNRQGADNIQILDPRNNFSTVRQFSTGAGSNPQDVAFAGPTKMYVTRNESNTMWIVNPQTGIQTGSIDFSPYADADGLCEMHQMFHYGDYLFVTVQRIDRNNNWTPVGDSYMAVIDMDTDAFVDTDPATPGVQPITLANANPFSEIQLDPWSGNLYVACIGYLGLLDAGVEFVDPVLLESAGTAMSETAALGDVLDVEIIDDNIGYCLIGNSSFATDLIRFDPSTGARTALIYAPGDWWLQDIDRAPTGELFLADRTPVRPGIRIYDANTGGEITTNPIDVGLPPSDITFSVEVQTGVGESSLSASLDRNFPNPFNPSTTIPYSIVRDARVVLQVYSVAGALIATLVDEIKQAGRYDATWNGLDESANPVPSGVYIALLKAGDYTATAKLVLLK